MQIMTLKKLGIASAILLAGAQTAYANDLQINGFLNVTAGVLDNEKIIDSPAAPGYDTTVGFDSQTLGGLQISKKVNDNTSATIQLMSRGSQDYQTEADRKSTRLNSSHVRISYAVFCLKKKKKK